MSSKILINIADFFELIVYKFNELGILRMGTLAILFLIIILACLLLKASSQPFIAEKQNCNTKYQKNIPGIITGSLTLVFSFIFIIIFMFGNEFASQFRTFYVFVIGGIFFLVFIMLLVVYFQNQVEPFTNIGTGICEKDGEFGVLVDGVCNVKKGIKKDDCKIELQKCKAAEAKAEEMEQKKPCECDKPQSQPKQKEKFIGRTADFGLCEYKDVDNVAKFGYTHPAFGKKCVSAKKMAQMLKDKPEYGKIQNVKIGGFTYNPYQSTQCYGNPKDDLVYYDLKCKDKFGSNYGLKKIEGFGCPDNDYRGMCDAGYQMGEKLGPDSTKCVPLGTDMNFVCDNKNKREKKTNFMKMGYKSIEFSGCPTGYQRAVCDGNYYSGKELIEKSTECFNQSFNPNRMCKSKYGALSFASSIISDNCTPGNIRAICANTKNSK